MTRRWGRLAPWLWQNALVLLVLVFAVNWLQSSFPERRR
jgi:hypothetical protein